MINYFLLQSHNYIAFNFCGDKYRLTEEEKKLQCSVLCILFWLSCVLMALYELSIVSQMEAQPNGRTCQSLHQNKTKTSVSADVGNLFPSLLDTTFSLQGPQG